MFRVLSARYNNLQRVQRDAEGLVEVTLVSTAYPASYVPVTLPTARVARLGALLPDRLSLLREKLPADI